MSNFHPANATATATVSHANDQSARLNWLMLWNEDAERHARLFRHVREEEQVRLMRRPIPTPEAFDLFGLLLGALVPAALFYRMFNYGFRTGGVDSEHLLFPLLLLAMNVVCCLIGWLMGAVVGRRIDNFERKSWHRMFVCSAGAGTFWGVVTGAAGGLLFFIIGALFGALIAIPVGILGFVLFTPLHRLMARGGMIDARHFWPLACGVVLIITALILSPNLYQ